MSRLTRDGTVEPVSRDQFLRHAQGQGNIHFLCSADHEQDWQPYPVDPYSAICDDHIYLHTYIHTGATDGTLEQNSTEDLVGFPVDTVMLGENTHLANKIPRTFLLIAECTGAQNMCWDGPWETTLHRCNI